jgi:hypothetical protein
MELILRKVERRTPDGSFEETKFADLKKGDAFKLHDPIDSNPRYEDGTTIYIALADASDDPLCEGNFGVMCDTEKDYEAD